MSALVGFDLDRTVVYSAAALMLEGPDEAAPSLVVTEVYQGLPLSFMTRRAERALEALAETSVVVPVTTRTVAQFQRIRLPLPTTGWAVTTNGAVVLHDGEPDEAWTATLRDEMAATSAPLPEVEHRLATALPEGSVLRTRRAEDLFVYAIVERSELPDSAVEAFAAELAEARLAGVRAGTQALRRARADPEGTSPCGRRRAGRCHPDDRRRGLAARPGDAGLGGRGDPPGARRAARRRVDGGEPRRHAGAGCPGGRGASCSSPPPLPPGCRPGPDRNGSNTEPAQTKNGRPSRRRTARSYSRRSRAAYLLKPLKRWLNFSTRPAESRMRCLPV